MPYRYLWSTGGETQVINNLNSDFYEVQIIDANGCLAAGSYQLTATMELFSQQLIRVYPNPSNGIVYLAFDSPLDETTNLSLYNDLGQKLQQWRLTAMSSLFSFDLEAYPAGVYALRVGDAFVLRLVKVE
jgi:hypothetical protein